ncbi:hypothetical protein LCGC14_1507140 [marine sediment metagenome]|uniref:Uncharacterized protein n=1 Tax=marine sediment metagenome TaxID=412755 RepID=A0A0F9J2T9_9ZZZZ
MPQNPPWRPIVDILYDMELGDLYEINSEETFRRLPGGWIYTRIVTLHGRTAVPGAMCSCWVPWETLFKKKPKLG